MNYIEETNKIPCLYDVDVLVCGGGPAGIGAAIRAAQIASRKPDKKTGQSRIGGFPLNTGKSFIYSKHLYHFLSCFFKFEKDLLFYHRPAEKSRVFFAFFSTIYH